MGGTSPRVTTEGPHSLYSHSSITTTIIHSTMASVHTSYGVLTTLSLRLFQPRTAVVPRTLPAISRPRQRTFLTTPLYLREAKQYDYKTIKSISQSPSTSPSPPSTPQRILYDVREPSEYASGHIPTARNLPLKTASQDFYLSDSDFADKYGFEKPAEGQEAVFYCLAGIRSAAAVDISGKAGWKGEVGEYKGSWEDWVERQKGEGKGEGEGEKLGYKPPTNDGNTPDLM